MWDTPMEPTQETNHMVTMVTFLLVEQMLPFLIAYARATTGDAMFNENYTKHSE